MRHPSLQLLSHDHHHGLAIALRCRKQALGQIKPMGAPGLRERAEEVLAFYESNLIAHFRAEEEILFPLLRLVAMESAPMIDDLVREHVQIRQAMVQLKAGAALAKLIFDFGDLLERHIRREERELFPLFEQQVHGSQAERIGAELKKSLEAKAET
jgi:iron-sulfur cluster repair protein YtfE (RIC family)